MASNTHAGDYHWNEGTNYLLKGYKYINGSIDFARYAADEGISIEAARKRFKRAFTSNRLNVSTRGDNIGTTTNMVPQNVSTPVKMTKSSTSTPTNATPTKTAANKRKVEAEENATDENASQGTPASKKSKLKTSFEKATVEDAPDEED